jgi:hypothetical protein
MCRRALLFAVAFCTFAVGVSVVTASAASAVRGEVANAATGSSGGTSRSSTATPHKVDVSALPRVGAGKPNARHLPLLVRDPAAYDAAKNNPKGTPGLAITQPALSPSGGTLGPLTPSFVHNFAGISSAYETGNAQILQEPPDTQVAVGPTWVLEMVNSLGQVYDKTGAVYPQAIGTFGLDGLFDFAFFSQTYFNSEQFTAADPRVLYDPSTGRFYASILALNTSTHDSMVLLGVSDTSDPAGFWTIYVMDLEGPLPNFTPYICDQPKLGYSADKFVLSCTLFDSTNTFAGAWLLVGTKAEGLNAVSMHENGFGGPGGTQAFGLVPAQGMDGGIGAAYVAYNLSNNGLGTAATHVVTVTGTPTANNVILANNNVAMNFTHFPPSAPQSHSTSALDTGDDRFMSAVVQGGVLYTSGGESCTPAGDNAVRSCLRLVEINLSSMTLMQGATAGLVGTFIIDPTLGVNSSGDAVFAYSTSSSTTYADVETAIQPAADPNTFVGGGQIAAGTGAYTGIQPGPTYRWGDYGSVAVDPSAPAYVFVAGEFSNGIPAGTITTWGTQIAEIYGHIAQVCTATGLATSLPSPQAPGTSITLTASASCVTGATPDYQFWIKPPSGDWTQVQNYGLGNTYNWTGQVTLGTYTLEVLVRATTETKVYDTYLSIPYSITATPCSVPTLTASPAVYPQIAGTPVMLTASTTCGAPPPLYQFWVRTPDLAWHLGQDYSTTPTYNWTTLDTQIGDYLLEVLVKNTGSLGAYDNFTSIPYSMQLCNAPTLSAGAASSPYASGSGAITLTATGTCAGGTQYQFYFEDPSSVWHLIGAGYSSSTTATWNADYRAGTYTLLVEIRPVGSIATYVSYTKVPFTLTGCGVPTLTSDLASPQVAGTTVHWTATATCSGTPQFQFYIRSPAGVWTLAQDWGASNTFAWTSPTTTGTYLVEVLVRNSGAAEELYDYYLSVPFTLGLCNAPTLSAGAASSPYASGSGAITLTATGTCAGGTQYQFYFEDPSSVWHLIGAGYSSSTTATWNADYRAGTYTLLVEIRPVGSIATYVSYTKVPFTLTGCGVPTLTSDLASPQVAGTTVHWTATATCSGTPQFQFYIRSPAGVWTLAQDWGASNTFAWTSPTTTGTYLVEVLVRNSGAAEDPYDNYVSVAYLLS